MAKRSPPSGEPVLAYDYPLLGVFWTVVLFSLFFLWIFTVLWTFVDNFRRRDHSGWAKAGWFILILFLPIFGVLVYLIARPADADVLPGQPQYR
jgi:Phospholipase_D-nuclease N-terminal